MRSHPSLCFTSISVHLRDYESPNTQFLVQNAVSDNHLLLDSTAGGNVT